MGALGSSGIGRSLLFAVTGILLFVAWLAGPSWETTVPMTKWLLVLLFSASLLALAVALPVLGRMVGGPPVARWANIAGGAAGLCSVANVFEDGFEIEWVFFVFILGILILDVALLALTIVVALRAPDRYRLLALVPAATLAGILFFPMVGGPVLLITWLGAAAAVAKMLGGQTPVPAAPATP